MLRRSSATFADGGRTVVLGPGRWRLIASLRPFRGRLIGAAVILLMLITAYGLRARADTAEFYPSSCLGTWEGVEHALGETELDGSPAEEFTRENSARFPGNQAQIFCGNFVGDIAAPTEAQVFRTATLSFVWSFRFPNDPASSTEAVSSSVDTTSPSPSSTAPSAPTSSPEAASGTTVSWWPGILLRARAQEAPPEAPAISPPSSPEPVGGSAPGTVGVPPAPQPPASSPSEGAVVSSPASSSEQATTTIIIEGTSSTPSSTLDIPWSITSPTADPTVVGGGEEDIFQITVSLDGKEWTSLGTVSRGNWRDAKFSLPIASWADLARLQVSIRGLSSYEHPEVFLDGMQVEVEYEEPGALGGVLGIVPPPPPPLPPPPPVDVPEAKHRCVIDPFAQAIRPGGQTAFSIQLFPSEEDLPYQVALGDLPEGVLGALSAATGSPPVVRLGLTASATTTPGSFSSVVMYRETNASGATVSTVCQYNLVVAP